jgi:fatty acid kinase fatty acid binding subunit
VDELLTRANTGIVTDSTSDPPAEWFGRDDLRIVPLKVHFGDETYRDGYDLTPAQFFAKLATSSVLPTTSQPSVNEFEAVYRGLRERYEHVFSVHITHFMSGTVEAARAAAERVPGVEVFDSGNVTTTISLEVARLWARLDRGVPIEELREYCRYFEEHSRLLIHAATLEYLRRGGRIDRAQSMIGDVFGIRPLVETYQGRMNAYAKVRGERRTQETMVGYLEKYSQPDDEIHLSLTHAANPEPMKPLGEALLAVRPNAVIDVVGAVAAVVGTHIGPGAVAFSMIVE